MFLYEITKRDVGRAHLKVGGRVYAVSDFMGRILPCDVGKRLFLVSGVVQVENDEQFNRRTLPELLQCRGIGNYKPGWYVQGSADFFCEHGSSGHTVLPGKRMHVDADEHMLCEEHAAKKEVKKVIFYRTLVDVPAMPPSLALFRADMVTPVDIDSDFDGRFSLWLFASSTGEARAAAVAHAALANEGIEVTNVENEEVTVLVKTKIVIVVREAWRPVGEGTKS